MSAQNDDEFSLDPTAPRAQPGPDERQSHGGSSPPQPHSSSSSSVTVSRQAPEAMHVGIRPQGMPGFHPAASSASYYPGAVFAGGAASAAPPPGAVPVPRHSYLFEARCCCCVCGVWCERHTSCIRTVAYRCSSGLLGPNTCVCGFFFHAFLQITMDQKRLTSNYPLVRCSMFDFSKNYVGPTLPQGRFRLKL